MVTTEVPLHNGSAMDPTHIAKSECYIVIFPSNRTQLQGVTFLAVLGQVENGPPCTLLSFFRKQDILRNYVSPGP
jgi:hypothetical protein